MGTIINERIPLEAYELSSVRTFYLHRNPNADAPTPKVPPGGGHISDPVVYCTANYPDGSAFDDIDLVDEHAAGGRLVTARLAKICVAFRPIRIERAGADIYVASQIRPFAKFSNWRVSAEDKSYLGIIEFESTLYEKGYYNIPGRAFKLENGKSFRDCRRNEYLPLAEWPTNNDYLSDSDYFLIDPFKNVDEWATLTIRYWHPSKSCI